MSEEELNNQDQKEFQSEVIRAIRDADLAIDQIRESFSLIFGMLEDRAYEWINNYEAVQSRRSENRHEGEIEELTSRHRSRVKPLWLVERKPYSPQSRQVEAASHGPQCCWRLRLQRYTASYGLGKMPSSLVIKAGCCSRINCLPST